jgi:hypothetical protein
MRWSTNLNGILVVYWFSISALENRIFEFALLLALNERMLEARNNMKYKRLSIIL